MNLIVGPLLALIVVFAVLAIRHMEDQTLRLRGLLPKEGEETMEHVASLFHAGKRSAAIRVYRRLHKVGLREASNAVDKLKMDR